MPQLEHMTLVTHLIILFVWVNPSAKWPTSWPRSTGAAVLLMLGHANCAAGPPKGIAKLSTVSESGRMRSPPLVDKFRRAKENMLQNWQSQPTNGKLLSLERMFHEVGPLRALLDTRTKSFSSVSGTRLSVGGQVDCTLRLHHCLCGEFTVDPRTVLAG